MSARPLIVTDCDEVLLHMVVPFGAWLADDHDILFRMEDASFGNALKRRSCGTPLEAAEVWPLLDSFFTHEMHRQRPIEGALPALLRLAHDADVVVLTNVGPDHQQRRVEQLQALGVDLPVIGSRGPKGPRVAELIAQYRPSVALFIDDLPQHHASVAEHAPDCWRLHMVGEPAIADKLPPAPHAHARIDHWRDAGRWIAARLGLPAPILEQEPA